MKTKLIIETKEKPIVKKVKHMGGSSNYIRLHKDLIGQYCCVVFCFDKMNVEENDGLYTYSTEDFHLLHDKKIGAMCEAGIVYVHHNYADLIAYVFIYDDD